MDKYQKFPFPVFVGNPGSDDSYRRMLAMMTRPIDPVILPVAVFEPTPIPSHEIDMFHHDPLLHTPIAITRAVEIGARRKPNLVLAMATVALLSTSHLNQKSTFRITGTAGLRERLKSLEKNLQRNPGRNDIKLQVMELRNQIRDIEAQNAKIKKAKQQQPKQGKRSR